MLHRYENNEFFTADSIRFADSLRRVTPGGKVVYGGGGIMPDLFVPADTTDITPYFIEVVGRNILFRYTLRYADRHRDELGRVATVAGLMRLLDSDRTLLDDFVRYAASEGVAPDYRDIDRSHKLLQAQLRAYIGRNTLLEESGFYANIYPVDPVMRRAVEVLDAAAGDAAGPEDSGCEGGRKRGADSLRSACPGRLRNPRTGLLLPRSPTIKSYPTMIRKYIAVAVFLPVGSRDGGGASACGALRFGSVSSPGRLRRQPRRTRAPMRRRRQKSRWPRVRMPVRTAFPVRSRPQRMRPGPRLGPWRRGRCAGGRRYGGAGTAVPGSVDSGEPCRVPLRSAANAATPQHPLPQGVR